MRVLVTGHRGYLGTVMAPFLHAAGHDVRAWTRDSSPAASSDPPRVPSGIHADIRDVTRVNCRLRRGDPSCRAVERSTGCTGPRDHLRHQPSRVGPVRPARERRGCATLPVRLHLLGVRLGGRGSGDRDRTVRPLTPYAESKVRVEDDVAAIADASFSPVFLRNATAFGFSPWLRADIVLNNLVGHAVLTGDVRVLSDGTPWRPLVHARDIAAAFLARARSARRRGALRRLQRGTESNNLTVADIAQSVADVVPGAELVITGETGADPRSYRVDFSAFRERSASRPRGRSLTVPPSCTRSTSRQA